MYIKGTSPYINGLTNMASSCTKQMGPSYMKAVCFDKKNYIESFKDYYNIPNEKVSLTETAMTLKDFLECFFGKNKEIIEGLMHWIHINAGDAKKVLTIEDENRDLIETLSGSDGGISGFYILEDIYFIEFDKMVICFTIGNDE